jgi:hypothetical protein
MAVNMYVSVEDIYLLLIYKRQLDQNKIKYRP